MILFTDFELVLCELMVSSVWRLHGASFAQCTAVTFVPRRPYLLSNDGAVIVTLKCSGPVVRRTMFVALCCLVSVARWNKYCCFIVSMFIAR